MKIIPFYLLLKCRMYKSMTTYTSNEVKERKKPNQIYIHFFEEQRSNRQSGENNKTSSINAYIFTIVDAVDGFVRFMGYSFSSKQNRIHRNVQTPNIPLFSNDRSLISPLSLSLSGFLSVSSSFSLICCQYIQTSIPNAAL